MMIGTMVGDHQVDHSLQIGEDAGLLASRFTLNGELRPLGRAP
jgi:hypothetical protein